MCGETPPPRTCCTCFILSVFFNACPPFFSLSSIGCFSLSDTNNDHFFIFLIKKKKMKMIFITYFGRGFQMNR